ncbi:hypothetical protein LMG27174_06129 [Paraburkholderia rhynchosiae]|uniref:Uncharacterized protein n=1 Tax=Paraburkholderia rhynchosiae TaxID=487049 RepID=A0A2N7W836_9BURK|nr:hypothetical protein C0Z16_28940 [Paraburkholderia rhynchosiae]CAB3734594.1 hypothetical protein LMG27174_06129 [Paraburkholderia rhynchosiae]
MRLFTLIRRGVRCAARIARRLSVPRLAVIFNAPPPGLDFRLPLTQRVTQHDPQQINSSEPLAAPVRPLSHAASERSFL